MRRLVAALLLVGPAALAVGAGAAPAAEPMAQIKPPVATTAAEPQDFAIATEEVSITTASGWRETWLRGVTPGAGELIVGGACPTQVTMRLVTPGSATRFGGSGVGVPTTPAPVDSHCSLPVAVADISAADPSKGVMLLGQVGYTPAHVPWAITRSSDFGVFVWTFVVAAILGLGAYFVAARSVLNPPADAEEPPDWTLEDGPITILTAITTAGVALLTQVGDLGTYFAQYDISGVVAANLLVAVLLAAAPLAYQRLAEGDATAQERAFVVAAGLTFVAAAAQLQLVMIALLSSAAPTSATPLIWLVAVLILVLMFMAVWTAGRRYARGASSASI